MPSLIDALPVQTLPALLAARFAASPDTVACSVQQGQTWVDLTWRTIEQRVHTARTQLARLGIAPGTTVAIMAHNDIDWDVVHWASLQLGARVVGLDSIDLPDNVSNVLGQTTPTVIVLASTELLPRLGPTAHPFKLITWETSGPLPAGAERLERTLSGEAAPMPEVLPSLVATTIFTSGTTGKPKSISYTHAQMLGAVQGISNVLPEVQPDWHVPSWLPQAHLFQRIINLSSLARGMHTYYVAKPLELAKLLPQIRPHMLVGVPRFYEKAWSGIADTLASKPPAVRRLASWALEVGRRVSKITLSGGTPGPVLKLQHAVADRLVLSSIRKAFGGRVQFMVSGAAPLPKWLLEEFHAIGLLVLESYGLSENIVPNTMNTPSRFRFGTVGTPMAATSIRLAEDGEIMVKGPGVYVGESTASRIDPDGWLSTGDLGAFDADGFLSIIGRKSEVVKSSTGRKVALPMIESTLRKLPWVDLPVVFALGRKLPLAVLFVNLARVSPAGSPTGSPQAALSEAAERLRKEIADICEPLSDFQRVSGVVLVARPPSLDAGELTANLKVKRTVIETRFAEALDAVTAMGETKTSAPVWLERLQSLVISV